MKKQCGVRNAECGMKSHGTADTAMLARLRQARKDGDVAYDACVRRLCTERGVKFQLTWTVQEPQITCRAILRAAAGARAGGVPVEVLLAIALPVAYLAWTLALWFAWKREARDERHFADLVLRKAGES